MELSSECKCLIVNGIKWHRRGCAETKPKPNHECQYELVEGSPGTRPLYWCRQCFDETYGVLARESAWNEAMTSKLKSIAWNAPVIPDDAREN